MSSRYCLRGDGHPQSAGPKRWVGQPPLSILKSMKKEGRMTDEAILGGTGKVRSLRSVDRTDGLSSPTDNGGHQSTDFTIIAQQKRFIIHSQNKESIMVVRFTKFLCLLLVCSSTHGWSTGGRGHGASSRINGDSNAKTKIQHLPKTQSRHQSSIVEPQQLLVTNTEKTSLGSVFKSSIAAMVLAFMTTPIFTAYAAVAAASPPALSTEQLLKQSLQPATEDRPAIPLPGKNSNSVSNMNTNVVQGLVYVAKPSSSSIAPTDTLVLQVLGIEKSSGGGGTNGDAGDGSLKEITLSSPPTVLAGAKIPVSKIPKFPFRFTLTESNYAASQQDSWKNALSTKDLLLRATICPDESPCNETNEQTYEALGIAKLLNFQQPQQGQQPQQLGSVSIRAPVSLPLTPVNQSS